MATPSLVNQVHGFSERLRQIITLLPKENPVAPPPGIKNTNSFLFEVKVLLILLARLKADGWSLSTAGKSPFVFARAPRPKNGISWIVIQKQASTFQLVSGAEIGDIHGTPQAPDISLQKSQTGENPTFADVHAIWDAKLRGASDEPSTARITKLEFAGFVLMHELLAVPKQGDGNDVLESWPPAFEVSGLISNGYAPTAPEALLLQKGVSIVSEFGSAARQCEPSRSTHLTSNGNGGP